MESSFLQLYEVKSKAVIAPIHSWGALTVRTIISRIQYMLAVHMVYYIAPFSHWKNPPLWQQHELTINQRLG